MAVYHMSLKSGKPGKAANHSNYIGRKGRYGFGPKAEDLLFTSHGNLPDWCSNDPNRFWKTADLHERTNGAAYREFELALPNELSLPQQIELVKGFISTELKNKPYQVAIHSNTASIGGVPQPHAHIMHSDRLEDGLKRAPELHFRRFNAAEPAKGGCRKDSGGREPYELKRQLLNQRTTWANLTNDSLEKAGYSDRVYHRSHQARGVSHEPERYLGQAAVRKLTDAQRKSISSIRAQRGF